MRKMNPVVHFEMPAKDKKRMVEFYSKVFGWTSQDMGSDMGDYSVMHTSEVDEKTHFPKEPGRINGGFFPKSKDSAQHPSVVIAVDDINEHVKIVKTAGGQVLGKPVMIPGVGKYVSFIDTEGNRLSMIQPSQMM